VVDHSTGAMARAEGFPAPFALPEEMVFVDAWSKVGIPHDSS
jgi:hypothetical protein